MKKRIAIVLSGCGFLDGGEIHESVLTLLHVSRAGANYQCFAPNKMQKTVTNHLTKDSSGESRHIMVEAARIARGAVKPLEDLNAADFDAVIFPGGYGAALNLCDFGEKGEHCVVDPQVSRVVEDFHRAQKPIGAICIAPALIARVLGKHGVELTIGTDAGTAAKLEAMGARPVAKNVDEIHCDEKNLVVSTPAYMLAKTIAEVDAGISKLVAKVLEM